MACLFRGFLNSLEIPLNPPLQKGDFMERGFPRGGFQKIILKSDHEVEESFTGFRISLREAELVRNDGFGEL